MTMKEAVAYKPSTIAQRYKNKTYKTGLFSDDWATAVNKPLKIKQKNQK